MSRRTVRPKPEVKAVLRTLGKSIRMARQRRGLSIDDVAERADVLGIVVTAIEKGEANVTMGAYANVLFALKLHEDLLSVALDTRLQGRLDQVKTVSRERRRSRFRDSFY